MARTLRLAVAQSAVPEDPDPADRKGEIIKTCDNTSVGIVITDHQSRFLMFDRATFPPGTAPSAGHIDDHGTAEDAGRAEVAEELGLAVTGLTHVTGGWRSNPCRRLPGARGVGHDWTIFRATVTGELRPSAHETKNVRWIAPAGLQELADRTVAYAKGRITESDHRDLPWPARGLPGPRDARYSRSTRWRCCLRTRS